MDLKLGYLSYICVAALLSCAVHARQRSEQDVIQRSKEFLQKRCDARFGGDWGPCMVKLKEYCQPRRRRWNRMCRMLQNLPESELGTPPEQSKTTIPGVPTGQPQENGKEDRGSGGPARGGGRGKGRGGGRYRKKKADRNRVRSLNERMNRRARRRARQQDPMRRRRRWRRKNKRARRVPRENDINKDGDYFMGDLELSEEQADIISKELDDEATGKRRKRKVGRNPLYTLWNQLPISYQFASDLPSSTHNVIRSAIAKWEANTCLRFQHNGPNVNRIEFYNGGGCSSYVGMTGGTQQISIATPGCDHLGIVAHEIGHALGFFHEQARPDQSGFVTINYDNINAFRWNNFLPLQAHEVDTKQMPYDYGSVMHYDGYGFATDVNQPTIETNDANYQSTIGQRNEPSFIDYAQVNAAYCQSKCVSRVHCENGGYPDPNDCARCKCPSGLGGTRCETVQYSTCGGELTAHSDRSHQIRTPNYPSRFRQGQECIWLIKSTSGRVNLKFEGTFDIQCSTTCEDSYVEVKGVGNVGGDFRTTGYRFCCDSAPAQMQSAGDKMIVIFNGKGQSSGGFQASYWGGSSVSKPGGKVDVTQTPKPQTPPPATVATTASSGGGGAGTDAPGCQCNQWGAWSGGCSQVCGGCGSRTRSRSCSGGQQCFGTEKRKCNFAPCPETTRFLFSNGEFHLLFQGCCLGLFKGNSGECGGIRNVVEKAITDFFPKIPGLTG